MSSKRKVLIIIMAVLSMLLILSSILYAMPRKDLKAYRRSIERAELAYSDGDYVLATLEYRRAINADRDAVEAYEGMYNTYISAGDSENAIGILREGYQRTKSEKLRVLLDRMVYWEDEEQEEEDEASSGQEAANSGNGAVTINTALISRIGTASYDSYKAVGDPGILQTKSDGSVYVRFSEIPGVMLFRNTSQQRVEASSISGTAFPEEVKLDSVSSLFGKLPVTKTELENNNNVSVFNIKDASYGYALQFRTQGCNVIVECSENGTVLADARCRIIPTDALENAQKKEDTEINGSTVNGTVIDAQTGKGVGGLMLSFRNKDDRTGEIIAEADTDDGDYSVEIPPGEYTVEISGDGYITDYINVTVGEESDESVENFVVSRELEEGEIRIVLEWGETPLDLDSHLTGKTDNGTSCHVYFEDMSCSDSAGTVAELDLDDTSSYGPETTTLYRISGEYDFAVNNYIPSSGNLMDSGATVTVYLPGSPPQTYSIEDDGEVEGDWWYVFTIDHGRLR